MGGATFGLALAREGKRVLFCEKGASPLPGAGHRGAYAELAFASGQDHPVLDDVLLDAGRWVDEFVDVSRPKPRTFRPYIGCGTGGSSALFGMALERLAPSDFAPRAMHGEAPESTLPERWPISYDDLAPYYALAERLYRVRGNADPLRDAESHGYVGVPPPFSPAAAELVGFLERKGLHPYHLPLACEYAPGCAGCQGYLCPRRCKNDSASTCLDAAIDQHGAMLIDRCEIARLESSGSRVTEVVARRSGREHRLRGAVIAMAAGALATPALLLRSRSREWPTGLANASGWVGNNLMRHFVDLYAVFPHSRPAANINPKEIGLNDFYAGPAKLGTVQSFGTMIPGRLIVDSLQANLRQSWLSPATRILNLFAPLVRTALDRTFARSLVLATITEDLPYRHNGVLEHRRPDGREATAIRYRISPYDKLRVRASRVRMQRLLAPYRYLLLKNAESNDGLAHACGTCRFGVDPANSVLDRNNKAHGLENLYVLDASFFPSSGGTNPALTIAANALRVADHLNGRRLVEDQAARLVN
ncbi:MAG TPA: GMC family oxidoreductase [Casimicrobiaceae bacterium]|nr:GMC family oxidoreductase [Casimicrobiaceae bacterium]